MARNHVWREGLSGRVDLREAERNRQLAMEEACVNNEAREQQTKVVEAEVEVQPPHIPQVTLYDVYVWVNSIEEWSFCTQHTSLLEAQESAESATGFCVIVKTQFPAIP